MTWNRRRSQRGLTLLELVVTLVVLSVLVAVAAPVVVTGVTTYVEGRALAEREQQASLALERFTRDVRRAAGVAAGGGEGNMAELELVRPGEDNVRYAFSDGAMLRNDAPLARRVDTGDAATFFRADRIPGEGDGEEEGAWHVSVSFRVDGLDAPFQATAVPR